MPIMPVLKSFLPKTLENRAALRTAVGVVLAIVISFALHIEKPYWAGMTVALIANIYTGNIIDKAIMRLLGTFIGVWFGFYLTHFVVNSLLLYIVVNFFIIAAAVYYYNFNKYAYAYLLGGIGAFFVVGQLAMNPQEAFLVAVWRPVEIGIGVVVSAMVALFIFPNDIGKNIGKEITDLFSSMDVLLKKLNIAFSNPKPDLNLILKQDNIKIRKKIRKASELISSTHREVSVDKAKIDKFRLLVAAFINLSQSISYFRSIIELDEKTKNPIFVDLADELFANARQDLSTILEAFLREETKITLSLPNLMADLTKLPPLTTKDELALIHFFRQLNTVLLDLQKALLGEKKLNKSEKIINAEQQLRNDPDVLIHSVKVGLTALLALAFWIISDWPGGLTGIISSIIISVKKNLFEMKNASILRFLGALIGGGLTLLIIAWLNLNFYLLILILFFAAWGFSYVAFKSTAYSYLGLQANVAVIITLAQAGGPPIDIAAPMERLAGVIIGIVASFIIGNLVWRTDLLVMLQRQLTKLKYYLFRNSVTLLTARSRGVLYDLDSSFWLGRGLLDTLDHESLSMAKQAKLTEASDRYKSLILLYFSLKNILIAIDQDEAEQTALQFAINLKAMEQQVAALFASATPSNLDETHLELETLLKAVLSAGEYFSTAQENLAAYLYALIRLVELRKDLIS
ncbi:p-hydroxybenzoic acid efflux pump subunit AaeB [Legionella beliardensis]|uniref:p-hydroxybenzoic acid efflux pump subunit AaeB n=1 Tax=Legionella beliardensis TaxID=91822 RepID=A0A378HZC5_9GAMM|nr:FUSC family protein [Legionella beliardensis]STX28267.1 p-hydroxybenzoic acid efflux pump subunit AaeB [Legionella beliardensis]